jgi:hypothetical protein
MASSLLRRPPEKVEALLLRPDLAVRFFSPFFFFFGSIFWIWPEIVGYVCRFMKYFDVFLLDLV